MIDLLAAAPPSPCDVENQIMNSPVANYRFSFIHATMGIVTIRNASFSDIPALREKLYLPYFARRAGAGERLHPLQRPGAGTKCPTERELSDFFRNGVVLMVTSPREKGEVVLAAISLFKADVLADLGRAFEHSTDGNSTVRIDRFIALEGVAGFDNRPLIVGKEILRKALGDARRKQGAIMFVHDVLVDVAYRKTDILKFISPKIIRMLKYAYRCSHIIAEDFTGVHSVCVSGSTGAAPIDSSNTGSSCRSILKGIELGHREHVDPKTDGGAGVHGIEMQSTLWIASCETIFDIPLKKRMLQPVRRVSVPEPHRKRRKLKTVF